ncbi:MAG: LysR family transcriptional regulator [Treponema sp.]|nr:LysR family transcriptional regulator [Treponema sp.]
MTLRQIEYIVEAERQGSLSSAAKILHTSQSTISFAIKELEREIGITIFNRSRNGIKATEEGLEFLAKARQALSAVNELEVFGKRPKKKVSSLRVTTVQSGIVPGALSKLTEKLEEENSAFRLQCRMCETSEVIDAVTDGQCDIGFIYVTDLQAKLWLSIFDQKGLKYRELIRTELFVILNATDSLASYGSLELSQLADHTFVFSGDDGLDVFSNLTEYSMQNFEFSGHKRYFDAQDSVLLNYLLHNTKSFTIGHRSLLEPYYKGLAFIPMKEKVYVKLMGITPIGLKEPEELNVLFESLARLQHSLPKN